MAGAGSAGCFAATGWAAAGWGAGAVAGDGRRAVELPVHVPDDERRSAGDEERHRRDADRDRARHASAGARLLGTARHRGAALDLLLLGMLEPLDRERDRAGGVDAAALGQRVDERLYPARAPRLGLLGGRAVRRDLLGRERGERGRSDRLPRDVACRRGRRLSASGRRVEARVGTRGARVPLRHRREIASEIRRPSRAEPSPPSPAATRASRGRPHRPPTSASPRRAAAVRPAPARSPRTTRSPGARTRRRSARRPPRPWPGWPRDPARASGWAQASAWVRRRTRCRTPDRARPRARRQRRRRSRPERGPPRRHPPRGGERG